MVTLKFKSSELDAMEVPLSCNEKLFVNASDALNMA